MSDELTREARMGTVEMRNRPAGMAQMATMPTPTKDNRGSDDMAFGDDDKEEEVEFGDKGDEPPASRLS